MKTLALLSLLLLACGEDQHNPHPADDTAADTAPESTDADADGFTAEDGDCDDEDASVHLGTTEVCNGVDDDCDGVTDGPEEDPAGQVDGWLDADGDGWGGDTPARGCPGQEGLVLQTGDCDDGDPEIHPRAVERPDGVDQDCDGVIDDEDCADGVENDGDGLLDCEDGDCADACSEATNCEDHTDNDEDGWTDCQDEDCWDRCTPNLRSKVHGGLLHMARRAEVASWWQSSIAFWSDNHAALRYNRADILSAWGTVQALTADRPDARVRATCLWYVSGGYAMASSERSDWTFTFARASSQAAPTLSAGCEDYADQRFRPGGLWPTNWWVDASVLTGPSGWGMPYQPNWYVGHTYIGWETATSSVRDNTFPGAYGGTGHAHHESATWSATADVVLSSGGLGFPIALWR